MPADTTEIVVEHSTRRQLARPSYSLRVQLLLWYPMYYPNPGEKSQGKKATEKKPRKKVTREEIKAKLKFMYFNIENIIIASTSVCFSDIITNPNPNPNPNPNLNLFVFTY